MKKIILICLILFLNVIDLKCQEIQPRIVGGFNVTSFEGFKHQVSIRQSFYDSIYGYGHICGGSLITCKLVLTAAHCFHDGLRYLSGSNYVISMGSLDRWVRDNNTLYINVLNAIGHDAFNPRTFENDIGIMVLSQEVPVNHPTVQPIKLSTRNAVVNASCQISGWGTISYEGAQPNRLKAAVVVVNSRSDCNEPNRYNGLVVSGMFCAGSFDGPNISDSCQGDSGGPLTCNGDLVGIISNGVECALPNFPGIYIDVFHYSDWILNASKIANVTECKNGSHKLSGNFIVSLIITVFGSAILHLST